MNLLQAISCGSLLMAIFNIIGMAAGATPPRPVLYAIIWVGACAATYLVSNV